MFYVKYVQYVTDLHSSPFCIHPLIYVNEWIAHCVLNCHQVVKPPEVFEPPFYYSLMEESTIDRQPKH